MDTDKHGFKHSEITDKVIRVFFEVYNELGHGFLESVYERSLEIALNSLGLKVCRQIQIPVWFRRQPVGDFTADMLVADCVLLELKAIRGNPPISVDDLLVADCENDDLIKPS